MTKYRFPITVSGFIEMDAEAKVVDDDVRHGVRIVVDEYGWEYGSWPRVSPYGDDTSVVQIDDGPKRWIEASANVVIPLREILDRSFEGATWSTSRTVEKDITSGTE